MLKMMKQSALAVAVLAAGVSLAGAQSGPVDGKGQTGSAHRGVVEPSGAKGTPATGDYDGVTPDQGVQAERNMQSGAVMSNEPGASGARTGGETTGSVERR